MMTRINRSDAEEYYIQNFQLLEGDFFEKKEEKALSPKLQDVISWFRECRREPFTLKKILIEGHVTYAFSTNMREVDHIFVFNNEGGILCILERLDACIEYYGMVTEFYPVNCPEQYWRHSE